LREKESGQLENLTVAFLGDPEKDFQFSDLKNKVRFDYKLYLIVSGVIWE
jgi:hypothetical protein